MEGMGRGGSPIRVLISHRPFDRTAAIVVKQVAFAHCLYAVEEFFVELDRLLFFAPQAERS